MSFLDDRMIDSGALARRLGAGGGLGPVNLLTRNQSSVEADTTGWYARTNCTIDTSSAQASVGSRSLAMTGTTSSNAAARTTIETALTVKPGQTYTAVVDFRAATAARSVAVQVMWWKADKTASSTPSTLVVGTETTSGWTTTRVTANAPSDAAFASIEAYVYSITLGEVHYVDKVGFWEGAGGSWVPGGERLDPSTLGHYWDESVGRRMFVWDTINSRWQMTYGDTGWRTVTAENSWSGTVYLRRIGQQVVVRTAGVAGVSASADTFYTLPTGYKPLATYYVPLLSGSTTTAIKVAVAVGGAMSTARPLSAGVAGEFSWMTNESWPTSLPGTASGSIPYA